MPRYPIHNRNRRTARAWLVCTATLSAALVAADSSGERLPLRSFTSVDGLPNDKIWRVRSDSRGFLWFGTSGGLARYDGTGFVSYGAADGLTTSVIDIIESRDGRYWLATNGGGVVRFLPERRTAEPKFATFHVGHEPRTNYVNSVFEDRDRRIWAGTDSGLFVLDESAGAFQRVSLNIPGCDDRSVQVWAFSEDGNGTLWIGTSTGLVRRSANGRTAFDRLAADDRPAAVFAFSRDRSGRLWIGGDFGLVVVGRSDAVGDGIRYGLDALGALPVRAVVESQDGRIWVATGSCLTEFDGPLRRHYRKQHGLVEGELSTLAEDRGGNLWIGTMGRGAMRLAADGFVSYDEQDGLGSRAAGTILEDADGSILVVSADHFLNRFAGHRFQAVRLPVPHAPTVDRRRALRDHTGDWWVVTAGGITRFPAVSRLDELARTAPRAVYDERSGLAAREVMRLFEDSHGDVWIGYRLPGRQVLTRWDRRSGSFRHYSDADGLPAYAPVRSFVEDSTGAVWIAFWEGGVACYRDGHFIRLTEAEGIPERQLSALHVDRQARLWFAAADRIGRIDRPAESHPQAHEVIRGPFNAGPPQAIGEDEHGNLYFGGVNGIERLDANSQTLRYHSAATGLASNEVVDAFRDGQGSLWFATTAGVSRRVVRAVHPVTSVRMLLTSVTAGGHRVPVSDLGEEIVSGIELGAGTNQLRVEFAALDFSADGPLRYRYKLEGADDDWTGPTTDRSVQYANLAPGEYRFVVAAALGQARTGTQATVSFSVLPPLWRRWWFLAGISILMAAVMTGVHRARVARVLAVERVRARIAIDLHDELGSSLSRVAVLSEVVKGDVVHSRPDVVRRLDDIALTARELLASTSDLVWSIHPQQDDLRSLIVRVRRFASDLLETRGIKWTVEVQGKLPAAALSPELRWNLLMILKEGLHNVVRHADARCVVLSANCSKHMLVFELRDDGCGLPPVVTGYDSERSAGGNGLQGMAARARAIRGSLIVSSAPDAGTSLHLSVPL